MNRIQFFGLITGPLLFILVLLFFQPDGLSKEANATLACALWISVWWITEAIPISATALLPLVLFPLTGVMTIDAVGNSFSNKMIFLFLGGFIIAVAIEKSNLHKRIALNIINKVGTDWNRVILGFMIATAFLSMWISNTATAVMVLPIGLSVVSQLNIKGLSQAKMSRSLMLAIAYGCSIGGTATLIGTPTNPIFAGYIEQNYGVTITFTQWMSIGLPFSIAMLSIGWLYLTKIAYKTKAASISGGKNTIRKQIKGLGPMKYQERMVLVVFVSTAFLWITRKYLVEPIIGGTSDALIAILGAIVLFVIPSANKSGRIGLIDWRTAETIPWGILLLFGGGLALAAGFQSSGLASWIGEQLIVFGILPVLLLILAIISVVNFLTEITSNVATAAMLMPVLGALALSIDVHPYILMVSATIAASCAFMLPVATPPNAVVFSSGFLSIPQMIRVGFWMNIISIVIATILIYILLPLFWDIKIRVFPEDFIKI
ncbi:SLC13 family permease [Winogradskyella sp.]|uniref:SLC13 family permease n=1 Tax=Winogradskyella sp. TaxID=1883156 RepID=UPI002602C202|nr:SLC13 family permease [Winogradskyella sp.]